MTIYLVVALFDFIRANRYSRIEIFGGTIDTKRGLGHLVVGVSTPHTHTHTYTHTFKHTHKQARARYDYSERGNSSSTEGIYLKFTGSCRRYSTRSSINVLNS